MHAQREGDEFSGRPDASMPGKRPSDRPEVEKRWFKWVTDHWAPIGGIATLLAFLVTYWWDFHEEYGQLKRDVAAARSDLADYRKQVSVEEIRQRLDSMRNDISNYRTIDLAELKRSLDAVKTEVAVHKCVIGEQQSLNLQSPDVATNIEDSLRMFRQQLEKPEIPGSDGRMTNLKANLDALALRIQESLTRTKVTSENSSKMYA